MGKGSTRRPTDQAKFESNFDEIDWGKGKKPKNLEDLTHGPMRDKLARDGAFGDGKRVFEGVSNG